MNNRLHMHKPMHWIYVLLMGLGFLLVCLLLKYVSYHSENPVYWDIWSMPFGWFAFASFVTLFVRSVYYLEDRWSSR